MDRRCVERLERVEDSGQLLVLDLDRLGGGAGLGAGGRRHGGHDVADVARHAGQDALVLDLAAVGIEIRDVVRREHDDVVRAFDRDHARVRVGGAHEGGVQHAGPLGVAGVALGAGHARVHETSSTARLTSEAITRRRYSADPRASPIGVIRSA